MFSISFMKNQLVNDEDINAIGYNLSNTVYTTFTNDTLYGVDALNEITAHMMNKGVKRNYKNECALSLADTDIHIDSGLAFFENGATITIDDDGIDLTLEDSAETQYVYLFFNDTINVGGARCTVEYPSGDFVMLGSITDGVLTQDRTFAYLNADAKGTNEVKTLILEPEIYAKNYNEYIRYKTNFNITGYDKLCFYAYGNGYNGSDSRWCRIAGVFDIRNTSLIGVMYMGGGAWLDDEFWVQSANVSGERKFYIEDGGFVMDWLTRYLHALSECKPSLTVELYGGAEE